MKGLIAYNSITGCNSKLAELLFNKFYKLKNDFRVEKIVTEGRLPLPFLAFYSMLGIGQKLVFETDFDSYDVIVIIGPVYANNIAPAVRQYVKNGNYFKNKQFFILPCCFTPAKNAIKQLSRLIQNKGGMVVDSTAIHPKNIKNSHKTEEMVSNLSDRILKSFYAHN